MCLLARLKTQHPHGDFAVFQGSRSQRRKEDARNTVHGDFAVKIVHAQLYDCCHGDFAVDAARVRKQFRRFQLMHNSFVK